MDFVDCVKSLLVIGYVDGYFIVVISIEDGKLDLGIENNLVLSSLSSCMYVVLLVKYDGILLSVYFFYDYEVLLVSDRVR